MRSSAAAAGVEVVPYQIVRRSGIEVMARLSAKLRSVAFDMDRERIGIAYWCPGCDESHAICTRGDATKGPVWSWDGNVDAPTCSPSIRVIIHGDRICHCFLRDGTIEFCGDSTHNLAGQTVALPDWPSDRESNFYLDPPHDFVT